MSFCPGRFLSLPVDTRWYTQYGCVINVLDNRDTLESLAAKTRLMEKYKKVSGRVIAFIQDEDFWTRMESLADVLKPVCEQSL